VTFTRVTLRYGPAMELHNRKPKTFRWLHGETASHSVTQCCKSDVIIFSSCTVDNGSHITKTDEKWQGRKFQVRYYYRGSFVRRP